MPIRNSTTSEVTSSSFSSSPRGQTPQGRANQSVQASSSEQSPRDSVDHLQGSTDMSPGAMVGAANGASSLSGGRHSSLDAPSSSAQPRFRSTGDYPANNNNHPPQVQATHSSSVPDRGTESYLNMQEETRKATQDYQVQHALARMAAPDGFPRPAKHK